jgi:hypothetical protein
MMMIAPKATFRLYFGTLIYQASLDGSEGGGSYEVTRQMYHLWLLLTYKRPYNMTQVGYSFLRSAVEGLTNPDDRAALIPDNNHLPLLREMIKRRRPMALVSVRYQQSTKQLYWIKLSRSCSPKTLSSTCCCCSLCAS